MLSPSRGNAAQRWLAAGVFAAAGLALTLLLREQISGTLFVFFFFAITLTAWYSGLAPSIAVTAISLLATDYFLMPPQYQLRLESGFVVSMIALGTTAVFISWLTNSLARALGDLEALNTDLAQSAQQAEAASRAKTEFLTIMSHELRTPLNAIIGYTDLLNTEVSGALTDAQRTQLSRIRSSSFHLLDLIQDVLSFSRIEAGRETLQLAEVEVARIVHDVAGYVTHLRGDKRLQHSVQLPAERLVMITDAAKLRQILINLVGNACKFTESGSVIVRVERDRDDVVFHVTDTGPGIAPEHHELIFEPFRQVDQSRTRPKDGAGLGLPVSRRLAHLLGGELHLRSALGEGSTFTLRLPVQSRLS